jgi:hypothetical protein
MAGYALIASESTRQVLSATVANDVEYCTIQTSPSGVIANIPVEKQIFDDLQAGVELANFADAIEQVMTSANISSATGIQSIDASGLLQDQVAFTVFYQPPGVSGTSVTAEALVPVGYLNFTDAQIGEASLANVDKIINDAYASLKAAAGG